jgi:hypothetical protein
LRRQGKGDHPIACQSWWHRRCKCVRHQPASRQRRGAAMLPAADGASSCAGGRTERRAPWRACGPRQSGRGLARAHRTEDGIESDHRADPTTTSFRPASTSRTSRATSGVRPTKHDGTHVGRRQVAGKVKYSRTEVAVIRHFQARMPHDSHVTPCAVCGRGLWRASALAKRSRTYNKLKSLRRMKVTAICRTMPATGEMPRSPASTSKTPNAATTYLNTGNCNRADLWVRTIGDRPLTVRGE